MAKLPEYIVFKIELNGLTVDITRIDDSSVENAIERQLPKKPTVRIEKRINGCKEYMCPNCKIELMKIDEHNVQYGHISKYCEYCGQHIELG